MSSNNTENVWHVLVDMLRFYNPEEPLNRQKEALRRLKDLIYSKYPVGGLCTQDDLGILFKALMDSYEKPYDEPSLADIRIDRVENGLPEIIAIWRGKDFGGTTEIEIEVEEEGSALTIPHVKDSLGRWAVPYLPQLDNDTDLFGAGSRQCNTSSHAMALDWLTYGKLTDMASAQGESQPESVYDNYVHKYGGYNATLYWEAHTQAFKDFGIASQFKSDMTLETLLTQVEAGKPTPIAMSYKSSGHVVCAVDCDRNNRFVWIHDPYGVRFGATDGYDTTTSGAYDKYSFELLAQIWNFGAGQTGWGRLYL